jgi:Domain of unknown function (DUF4384)
MKTKLPTLKRLSLACLAFSLSACITTETSVKKDAGEALAQATKGPERPSTKNITNFSDSLRCMDTQFINFGIGGITLLSEEITDATKKVNAGTKDMLITAISRMSARSRAIKMIAYGSDSTNTMSMLREKESKSMVENLPQFAIRGSISQLDESIGKKTEGLGLSLGGSGREAINAANNANNASTAGQAAQSATSAPAKGPIAFGGGMGRAAVASYNELGLDLNMIRVSDLSVINGVNASNKVAILRSGVGTEGEAEYFKFGFNFQTNLSKSEGQSQALRNLVELAAIELLGKLTKVPYWKCLGADEKQEAVKDQINEWFTTLYSSDNDLIEYWQDQMRVRGLFTGDVNGEVDDNFKNAIIAYRTALGMERAAKLGEDFFTAYLSADHAVTLPKARLALTAMLAPQNPVVAAVTEGPLSLKFAIANAQGELATASLFKKGEPYNVKLQATANADAYCYIQDDKGAISRFFPNRFSPLAAVGPAQARQIPSVGDKFTMRASRTGQEEKIMCLAIPKQLANKELPAALKVADFEPVSFKSLTDVRTAYERALSTTVAHDTQTIKVRP